MMQKFKLLSGDLPSYEDVANLPRRTPEQLKKYCHDDLPPEMWAEFGYHATKEELIEYHKHELTPEEREAILCIDFGVCTAEGDCHHTTAVAWR
jgi:hypothetical protein